MKEFLQTIGFLILLLVVLLFFGPLIVILSIVGKINLGFGQPIDISHVKPAGRVAMGIVGLFVWILIYLPLGWWIFERLSDQPTVTETAPVGATPFSPLGPSSTVTASETPTPSATPFFLPSSSPTAQAPEQPIESEEWCVFIVPEGEEMHIRDIVGRFLQEGDVPEHYREQVFEATGGQVWYNVWDYDVWDVVPLPQDRGSDGRVITARVALGFVRNVTDCTDNGGRIRKRPSASSLATPQPTLTVPLLTPIQDGYWCVFIVPEGTEMTIRDIVGRFLQREDSPDNYIKEVFEATSGTAWYNVWSSDAWDIVPLSEETLEDGTVVTARLGLGFVEFEEQCIDNGGVIWRRYNH
jgi:ABC-type glycerol-3-phosphate transport system permease component